MIVICYPAMAGSFSFIASFSWLVSGAVNKAVKFKAVLLASKSNILYRLNPSTKGFTSDASLVPFKAVLSWARFSQTQPSQEQRPVGLVE